MNMQITPRAAEPAIVREAVPCGSSDHAMPGTAVQIVGEMLCEAIDLRSGQRALDVAAGSGGAMLAAARRFAQVTATDASGAWFELARARAKAERFAVAFREADPSALPFDDAAFDAVLSTFGVALAPNQERVAKELLRVCRPGGRIGLACWTPDSFIGQLHRLIGQYVPAAQSGKLPMLWGTRAHLGSLFGPGNVVVVQNRQFAFRARSPEHWLELFAADYAPLAKTFATLAPELQMAFEEDIHVLLNRFNLAHDGTLVAPSEYLEVVVAKKR